MPAASRITPSSLRFLVAAFLLILSGCASPPEAGGENDYVPPPQGMPAAFVKGAEEERSGLFDGNHSAYVSMVDLRPVRNAADRAAESLPIAAGKRSLGVEYRYSNLMALAYVPLEARAGVTYQLVIKHGREPTDESRLFCEFWIVDTATGKPVTDVIHRQITGGKKGTIFYINK